MPEELTGLRERKKLATRAALGQAAWQLTIERGYAHTRVEDIAAAAGVSARTFSNYFSSKEEALLSVGEDRGARMVAALQGRPDGEDPWELSNVAYLPAYRDVVQELEATLAKMRG